MSRAANPLPLAQATPPGSRLKGIQRGMLIACEAL